MRSKFNLSEYIQSNIALPSRKKLRSDLFNARANSFGPLDEIMNNTESALGAWLSLRWALCFIEAHEELRIAAKISEEEGDTPTLSYIRDLIEQLNRALREVTFAGEDQCLKSTLRRLSPRNEKPRISEGNEAITTPGIRRTTARSKGDDALTPSFCSDYLDSKILEQREIGITLLKACRTLFLFWLKF